MARVTLRAPAKLNLYLHILGRRADKYHALESLAVFTECADELAIEPADNLSLNIEGEFADEAGSHESNLVVRAAKALQVHTNTQHGAQLTLTKNIPVGAGLGGGSADAAAALRGLNRFWQLGVNQRDLQTIAKTLGADVPMCLDSIPTIARGIGEQLAPILIPFPAFSILLVYPRAPLLTKNVYDALEIPTAAKPWVETLTTTRDFFKSLTPTRNHLQRVAISISSAVAEVLLALETLQPAADIVRMSGSGACCFALYADHATAQKAAQNLAHQHPHWWVKLTAMKRD